MLKFFLQGFNESRDFLKGLTGCTLPIPVFIK